MVAPSSAADAAVEFHGPSPFHNGEQRVQALTGAREISERLGRSWHSTELGARQTQFFARQQLLYTATKSADGRLWASVLAGPEGFLSSPEPKKMIVQPFKQFRGDPARFSEGDSIGTLGIVLETRQRERLNGKISKAGDGQLVIDVEQSFGGCPKYIQARKVEVMAEELEHLDSYSSTESRGKHNISSEAKALIERSDTLFLATCYQGSEDAEDGVSGNDISHRGGPPGFVKVTGEGTLQFADYVGNYTFTTLGNLLLDSSAAIQFLDFETGTSLQLSGRCGVLWEERRLPGAQRTLEFSTEAWLLVHTALPLRSPGAVRFSPYNPPPSLPFSAAVAQDRLAQLVNNYIAVHSGVTVLRCMAIKEEAAGVRSFQFETGHRGDPNAFCQPGQFASFDFEGIAPRGTLNRTWTVSSPPSQSRDPSTFSITVKKVGLVSSWMFDHMSVGRTIGFRGIDGDFTLDLLQRAGHRKELLFIAGGIGITPLKTMFIESVKRGIAATLMYSVRHLKEAAFLEELQQVVKKASGSFIVVALTGDLQPPKDDSTTTWFMKGRITAKSIKEARRDMAQCSVFQCGPVAMMKSIQEELACLKFPMDHVHQELFNF